MTDPAYDLISDYEREIVFDSCEMNFVQIILTKRFLENKFPTEIEDLETLSISDQIIDSLVLDSTGAVPIDSLRVYYNQVITPWIEYCKYNYDNFSITPYGLDSLDISWSKHKDCESGKKRKTFKEEWRLIFNSEMNGDSKLLNFEVVLFDSEGKELSYLRGNEDKVKTKQKYMKY